MAATKRNEKKALHEEAGYRRALLEGKRPFRRITVREFSDAAKDFLEWARAEHRAHPNTYRRLATSFSSLMRFFGRKPVSLVDEGQIETYKT